MRRSAPTVTRKPRPIAAPASGGSRLNAKPPNVVRKPWLASRSVRTPPRPTQKRLQAQSRRLHPISKPRWSTARNPRLARDGGPAARALTRQPVAIELSGHAVVSEHDESQLDKSSRHAVDTGAHPSHDEAGEAVGADLEAAEEAPDVEEDGNGQSELAEAEEEEIIESVGGDDAMEEVPDRAPRHRRQYKIQEVIKRRQIMLVQVVKEERGTKGAALTTYLSLAGR